MAPIDRYPYTTCSPLSVTRTVSTDQTEITQLRLYPSEWYRIQSRETRREKAVPKKTKKQLRDERSAKIAKANWMQRDEHKPKQFKNIGYNFKGGNQIRRHG